MSSPRRIEIYFYKIMRVPNEAGISFIGSKLGLAGRGLEVGGRGRGRNIVITIARFAAGSWSQLLGIYRSSIQTSLKSIGRVEQTIRGGLELAPDFRSEL